MPRQGGGGGGGGGNCFNCGEDGHFVSLVSPLDTYDLIISPENALTRVKLVAGVERATTVASPDT